MIRNLLVYNQATMVNKIEKNLHSQMIKRLKMEIR